MSKIVDYYLEKPRFVIEEEDQEADMQRWLDEVGLKLTALTETPKTEVILHTDDIDCDCRMCQYAYDEMIDNSMAVETDREVN